MMVTTMAATVIIRTGTAWTVGVRLPLAYDCQGTCGCNLHCCVSHNSCQACRAQHAGHVHCGCTQGGRPPCFAYARVLRFRDAVQCCDQQRRGFVWIVIAATRT